MFVHRTGMETVGTERQLGQSLAVQPDAVVLAEPAEHLRVNRHRRIEEKLVVLVAGASGPQFAPT
jgi:hypothetical protein